MPACEHVSYSHDRVFLLSLLRRYSRWAQRPQGLHFFHLWLMAYCVPLENSPDNDARGLSTDANFKGGLCRRYRCALAHYPAIPTENSCHFPPHLARQLEGVRYKIQSLENSHNWESCFAYRSHNLGKIFREISALLCTSYANGHSSALGRAKRNTMVTKRQTQKNKRTFICR